MVTKSNNCICQCLVGFLSTLTLKWKISPKRFLLNKRHSRRRIKNKVFVLNLVLPHSFPSAWPMSNAAVVTQALFGGGHSTALLLATGGLLSCSDLFSHVVVNVFDLLLLSRLEWSLFPHGARDQGRGRLLFVRRVAFKHHPAWPTNGAV